MSELKVARSMGGKSNNLLDTKTTMTANRLLDHGLAGRGYALPMRPLSEIRRKRLRQLIDEVADGNQSQFANAVGRSRSHVGTWLTDPAKPHARPITDATARELEQTFAKPKYWLDRDPWSQDSIPDLAILTTAEELVRAKELLDGAPIESSRERAETMVDAYRLVVDHGASIPPQEVARFLKSEQGGDDVVKRAEGGRKGV